MPIDTTQEPLDDFERSLNEFLEREAYGFDELPASTFFELMAEIEREKMEQPIELEADITDGEIQLALLNSAGASVKVQHNEIIIEGRRILVHPKSSLPAAVR